MNDAVEKCNTDSRCGCISDEENDGLYSTREGTGHSPSSGDSAWVYRLYFSTVSI